MPLETPEEIMEMAGAFRQSRVILAGFELGIFAALGDAACGSAEVAAAITTDPRGTERLMNALAALGLLVKKGGLFSNTTTARRCLVPGGADFLSGLGHTAGLYRSWATLDGAVRAGTSVQEGTRDDASLEFFIAAMHRRARESAPGHVALLDLNGVRRVLDIGGGSGVYAMAFVNAAPDSSAVVFDLPPVAELAKRYIAEAGLTDRVTTQAGDYLRDEFGTGYDLVFMSAIVHINNPDENRDLVRRAAAAVKPGGQVVISDHVMFEDRSGPLTGAIFSLNMLVNTRGGDTYTESEQRMWLEDAGCGEVKRIDIGPGLAFMIGRKMEAI